MTEAWSRQRAAAAGNAEAILRAAAELFREAGVEAVSMRQIAQRAGVGLGTLYRRYGDKAALLSAVVGAPERELQDRVLGGPPPLGPGAPPVERLEAFLDALAELTDAHLPLLLAAEAAAPGARLRVGAYAAWHLHVATLVAEERPDADAAWLATLLLAPFDAEIFRHQREVLDRRTSEIQANLRATARALLAGVPGRERRRG